MNRRIFDNRQQSFTPSIVTVKPPSFARLSPIYQVSRQRLYQVAKQFGRPALLDPDALFFAIGQRQPIVKALSDPAQRRRIKSQISKLQS